jgi:arginase
MFYYLALKEVHPDLKVIWIDAHGDIIIPSKSDYHNYHGMPVSHVMNLIPKEDISGFDWMKTYIKTDELVFFGVRDIDNDEKLTLKENKIKCFTPDHIHKNGGN